MSADIRLPNITATTDRGKLEQMRSYLYQMVEQLNYALSSVEKSASEAVKATTSSKKKDPVEEAQASFSEIKSLIIKSADIVNAYYDTINARLEGVYVAEATFPGGSAAYIEQTAQDIQANADGILQNFEKVTQILTDIDGIEDRIRNTNAYIKTGLLDELYDGTLVYGLEIGQTTAMDGQEVFNRYARFTSNRLSFFDSNDNEVAYISDRKLYISNFEITGSFIEGGFVDTIMADGSVVTKWVGIGG